MRLDAAHQATPLTSRADTSSAFSTSPISRIERFDSSYQATRGSSRTRSRGLLGWGVAGASLAAVALLLILLVSRSYDIARRDRDLLALRSQLQQAQRELAVADKDAFDLRQELDSRTRLTRVLLAPDMEVYKLAPLLPSFGATGLLTVSTSNRTAMLETAGLPIVPEGKVYEFWWIGSQRGPLKGGLFRAESGRETIVAVTAPPVGELIVASAITLEPAGGVSKPTGTMYLKSLPPSR
jgi:anti-sigma-K factor RskA